MSDLTKEHDEFREMKSRWDMCKHAAEGEYAVHKEGVKYLPKLRDEEDDAYALRLRMTPFFNATWRTISGMRGMLFRKPPRIEVDAKLNPILDDIDLAGTSLAGLAQELVEEALTYGRVGLLVDYPPAPVNGTLADTRALSLRPMISLYETCSIYNWKEISVGGVRSLVQVRLIENADVEQEDEFATKTENRYRVLDLVNGVYRQRIFRVGVDGVEEQFGEDVYPKMNGQPMKFIPFVGIGVDCVGLDVDAPPLIDLVTTNFHHYLQATSYERGCFFSGLPTMFVSGMEDGDGEIAIGGPIANALGSPNAKAYYVEVSSEFNALRTNLEDKKREMAVLGARMLESNKSSGVEAAETVARRQSGEESVLATMAQSVSIGISRALTWASLWMGGGQAIYELNRDFLPQPLASQDISALVSAWQNGAISQETLFDNLKAGEIVADEVTFEDEQSRIETATLQLKTTSLQDQATQAELQAQLDAQFGAPAQGTPTALPDSSGQPAPQGVTPVAPQQPIDLAPVVEAVAKLAADVAALVAKVDALKMLEVPEPPDDAVIIAQLDKLQQDLTTLANKPEPNELDVEALRKTIQADTQAAIAAIPQPPAPIAPAPTPPQPAQVVVLDGATGTIRKTITITKDASGNMVGDVVETKTP